MESNWISVKDRLPERDGTYLCRYSFEHDGQRSGMMFTGCVDYYATDPEPHWQNAGIGLYVTHWMPLPEPPEEDTERNDEQRKRTTSYTIPQSI